jgi:hypothetical protein
MYIARFLSRGIPTRYDKDPVSENLDQSSTSQPANSDKPDDLLAQLAGEEVDRLLAEAEVDRAARSEGEAAPVEEEEAAALTAMLEESARQELDAAVKAAAGSVEADKPAPPSEETSGEASPPAEEAQEDVSAQLDQLFAALTTADKRVDDTALSPAETRAKSSVAAEEKAALGEKSELMREPEEQPLPWWIRPLRWINAPFDFLPDSFKEKLGWIGIQTLIFAAIILAYVWWRHAKK